MLRMITVLGAVLCVVCALSSVSEAQVGGGQITGIVTDSREAPVPGATVTATLKTRSAGRTVVSSSSGVYTVPGLSPGDYRIDVELTGFRTTRREGVRVETSATMPPATFRTTNFNVFAGFGTQRPNLIGDPTLPEDARTPAKWFNTAAFSVAAQFTVGNASRNPVRGPGYRNVDLAISRRLPLTGRSSLEVRAEAFNLLNHPPVGNPNGVLGSASFGSISSAGDPRVVQLAVKYLF